MRKLGPSLPTPQTAEPKVEFVQDWTDLLEAANGFYRSETPFWTIDAEQAAIIHDYVPKLIQAYTELWGLTSGLMAAWEQLQVSKDSLYVPDASDMMKGL